ncbi:membrane protein [Caenispirillum salinarum]|uniref:membrane protein n=1 Tax=Caenispirillum salinarum TaxID=859058 RepID=UPI0005BB4B07|nr:membrane protein [Caenispirillum salinarum]
MDDLTWARALHVLAVVHWIGGVAMVTAVILPAVRRLGAPGDRLALFEAVEGRFSRHAKISVTLAGLSGFYMTERLDAWDRFADPGFWWMHAMVLVWTLFAVVLFIAEPLVLHRWIHRRAQERPEATFTLVQRAHWVLLILSAVTVGASVLGAHGVLF